LQGLLLPIISRSFVSNITWFCRE